MARILKNRTPAPVPPPKEKTLAERADAALSELAELTREPVNLYRTSDMEHARLLSSFIVPADRLLRSGQRESPTIYDPSEWFTIQARFVTTGTTILTRIELEQVRTVNITEDSMEGPRAVRTLERRMTYIDIDQGRPMFDALSDIIDAINGRVSS